MEKRVLTLIHIKLINIKGGKCEICGYNKNIAALEFHHLDPAKKNFQLDSRHISNRTWKSILDEAENCILVCSNCHRELHNPDLTTETVNERIKNEEEVLKNSKNWEKVKTSEKKQTLCKHCGTPFDAVCGKIYCSKECREADRNWPTKEQLLEKRKKLGSWTKVKKLLKISMKTIKKILNS